MLLIVNPGVLQLPSRCQVCIRKGVHDTSTTSTVAYTQSALCTNLSTGTSINEWPADV